MIARFSCKYLQDMCVPESGRGSVGSVKVELSKAENQMISDQNCAVL